MILNQLQYFSVNGDRFFLSLGSILRFHLEALPFNADPFLLLRGVPGIKYQGEITSLIETEWRGFVYER